MYSILREVVNKNAFDYGVDSEMGELNILLGDSGIDDIIRKLLLH